MTNLQAIVNLRIIEKRWEEDENMYSDSLDITIDDKFMETIYHAHKVLENVDKITEMINEIENKQCRGMMDKMYDTDAAYYNIKYLLVDEKSE